MHKAYKQIIELFIRMTPEYINVRGLGLRVKDKRDHLPEPRKMTLIHEHLLACERCNSPLFISRLDRSSPQPSTARTRLILTYEQTVASIFEGQADIPSYLCDMREDAVDAQHHTTPSLTSLHVLNMEGFEKPDTRRDFANHCALDSVILESHFVTISRLVGADVGVCWCECHAGKDHRKSFRDAHEEDNFRPMMLSPIMEYGIHGDVPVITDGQKNADQLIKQKRRRNVGV